MPRSINHALNGGSAQGYRVLGSFLVRMPGSHCALGLDPNATPQFTTTPGQVAFTPDGTGQAATCWVTPAGSFLFASNAGTPSESGFTSSASGQLSPLGNTATDPGAVDAASAESPASSNSRRRLTRSPE